MPDLELVLIAAGLVEQRREGRVLRCVPVFEALDETIGFLTESCCAGSCGPTADESIHATNERGRQ